ncbi:SET and MYND domain-containing protein 4 [Eufriesea mexicana]|uniref:Protein-lysine N-methyltransferase SMYD4 n=1 Tax=Eufriesea mexicana TaxID=516756 RepID=A0A310SDC0_9HYME|nr:SET and MYND domain-containing protein 4 [Eufriesea mexicana]
MGNKEFQAKDYVKSIELYTKCAQYAPANSCELPIAIANRSASLFYLNRYDDCIKDIELAIKLNYPKHLQYKLYLRAIQCYLKLNKQHLADEMLSKLQKIIHDSDIETSMKDSIKLKIHSITDTELCVQNIVQNTNDLLRLKSQIIFEENVNFPNASVNVDIVYNEEVGRHVVANKYIKKGDILFLEKPICFTLLSDNIYNLCQYCNCSNMDIPVPCTTCLNTFYCDNKCLSEAWTSYHCWECPGSQMELWKNIGLAHLALKVLLTCSTTKDEIKFNDIQNLDTPFDKLPAESLILYGITAIMLTTYLLEYTTFFKTNNLEDCLMKKFLDNRFKLNFNITTSSDKHLYISSLLLRYSLQLSINAHTITRLIPINGTEDYKDEKVAAGIYTSASMMNHSCDPNIINIFVNDYLIVRASRDITEGEEISNCYGPHYAKMPIRDRQYNLQNQYYFKCKCKACTLPELRYFVERFHAMKCRRCNGALCNINNFMYCLDCNNRSQIQSSNEIRKADEIFEAAQAAILLSKPVVALDKLKKCLHIRRAVLYKYNEDITLTLHLMGDIYKAIGQWVDSIMCFENVLAAIRERCGPNSRDSLHYLLLITILKKAEEYLNEIEEITNHYYGTWSKVYDDVKKKQKDFILISYNT